MKLWAKAPSSKHKLALATVAALLLWLLVIAPVSASPLIISNVSSGNITETTAIITWTTDEPGNSTVNYGNSTDLGLTVSDGAFTTSHSINLSDLNLGTLYYYEVISTNEAGNETVTDNNQGVYYTFTTEPYPPAISGISVSDITDTSTTVTWITDRLADSTVNYGETASLGSFETSSGFVLNHTIIMSGLIPNTMYYYEISSTNQYGNTTVDNNDGDYYTFTTEQAYPAISSVSVINITDTSATVTWTTDQATTSTVNYGNSTPPQFTASDAALVYYHNIDLTGLSPNTLYYCEISSTNQYSNTTVDDNEGDYYNFHTAESLELQGWGWFTNYDGVGVANFNGYAFIVERSHAPDSYSMHVQGNLTLQIPDTPAETVTLDMYGSRVRSLFYLRQEVEGKSATFTGSWIDSEDAQRYVGTTGMVALPNPEGESFKTARLCFLILRTPDIEVPAKQTGGFAANIDVIVAWVTKFFDKLLDSLVGTGAGQFLGDVLAKLMILIAALRGMGTPYVP